VKNVATVNGDRSREMAYIRLYRRNIAKYYKHNVIKYIFQKYFTFVLLLLAG